MVKGHTGVKWLKDHVRLCAHACVHVCTCAHTHKTIKWLKDERAKTLQIMKVCQGSLAKMSLGYLLAISCENVIFKRSETHEKKIS